MRGVLEGAILILMFSTSIHSAASVSESDRRSMNQKIERAERAIEDKVKLMRELKESLKTLADKYFGEIEGVQDSNWYLSLNFYLEALKSVPWESFDQKQCSDYEAHVLFQFDPMNSNYDTLRNEVRWVVNQLRQACK